MIIATLIESPQTSHKVEFDPSKVSHCVKITTNESGNNPYPCVKYRWYDSLMEGIFHLSESSIMVPMIDLLAMIFEQKEKVNGKAFRPRKKDGVLILAKG